MGNITRCVMLKKPNSRPESRSWNPSLKTINELRDTSHNSSNNSSPSFNSVAVLEAIMEKKNEKNGQELIQEISSSVLKENYVTKISETTRSHKSDNSDALVSSFHGTSMIIEIFQYLVQLYNKAFIAEEYRLEANQEEIFCWYQYGRNFIFQLEALYSAVLL
ncbi:unnamed protein product [Rhizophagus irregularis]|nr:unnamed protein product [Rhizophagus irregularis]